MVFNNHQHLVPPAFAFWVPPWALMVEGCWQPSNIGPLLSLSLVSLVCCPWFLCRSFPGVCQSLSVSLVSCINVLQHFSLFLFSLLLPTFLPLCSLHSCSPVFTAVWFLMLHLSFFLLLSSWTLDSFYSAWTSQSLLRNLRINTSMKDWGSRKKLGHLCTSVKKFYKYPEVLMTATR